MSTETEWIVDYLVAKEGDADRNPPADATLVPIHVEASNEHEARDRARGQIFRQYPDEMKWERGARAVLSSSDEQWASGVTTPGGKTVDWPFPWQRGTDKYDSWCVDCGGEANVYDGHIISYAHKEDCPNRGK